jgi:RHS repeat-associated protein
VSASSNGVLIATFTYDPRNRCVIQTIPSTTRYLTYDGWSLLEERDAAGVLQSKYVHGPVIDEIIVRYNGSPVWYHHDGLGSTTHLTDNTGSVVESYRYDVFGAPSFFDATGAPQPSSLHSQRFLFTGREWLAEVGLYDYRNRMYSPGLGRFLQTDSERFGARDENLYRYVTNDPLNSTDPLGLTSVPVSGIAKWILKQLGEWGLEEVLKNKVLKDITTVTEHGSVSCPNGEDRVLVKARWELREEIGKGSIGGVIKKTWEVPRLSKIDLYFICCPRNDVPTWSGNLLSVENAPPHYTVTGPSGYTVSIHWRTTIRLKWRVGYGPAL